MTEEINPYQAPKPVQEVQLPKPADSQKTLDDTVAAVILGSVTCGLVWSAAFLACYVIALVLYPLGLLWSPDGGKRLVLLAFCLVALMAIPAGPFLGFKAARNYLAKP